MLRPAMLERQLAAARDRLARTAQLLAVVNPDRLLMRGYARVSAQGTAITTAAAARRAGALTLHFGDGEVAARVERTAAKPYDKSESAQPSLL